MAFTRDDMRPGQRVSHYVEAMVVAARDGQTDLAFDGATERWQLVADVPAGPDAATEQTLTAAFPQLGQYRARQIVAALRTAGKLV